jgi:hypothetical protein
MKRFCGLLAQAKQAEFFARLPNSFFVDATYGIQGTLARTANTRVSTTARARLFGIVSRLESSRLLIRRAVAGRCGVPRHSAWVLEFATQLAIEQAEDSKGKTI